MSLLTWLNPSNLIGKGIDAVSGYQQKKKDKEILKIRAQSKLELAKQAGKTSITLKDQEWESISVSKSDSTWKDEYVTLVVTWPLIGVLAGSLLASCTGNTELLDGTLNGIKGLKELGMDFGILMTIVVSAAVSIKAAGVLRK